MDKNVARTGDGAGSEAIASAIDHVSITASFDVLAENGYHITPTMGCGGRHARVMLDRTYLEVSPGDDGTAIFAREWFLRPANIHAAPPRLRRLGVPAGDPTLYEGHDGNWLDVEIHIPALAEALPILTCRLDAVGPWPPPLSEPHPNGALAITEVHLCTNRPVALLDVLEALGGQRQERRRVAFGGDATVRVAAAGQRAAGLTALVLTRPSGSPLRLELAASS